MPPFILESIFVMRISRVSAFFPDVTQQIHSFRASGVMSSHNACTLGFARMAFLTSGGSGWIVPGESLAGIVVLTEWCRHYIVRVG